MVFTMCFGMFAPTTYAANVAINLGVGSKVDVFDNTYPVTDQSSAETTVSTPSDVFLQWTAGGEYAIGNTVTIIASAPLTIANTCATPTTDADQNGVADGAAVISGNTYTYTFTAATLVAVSSVTFCINVTTPVTAGNYSFIMGGTNAAGDVGGAFLYSGVSGGLANDVTITADVAGEELEFEIRDDGDLAATSTCALGTLSTLTVSTCGYRLKIRTTATNGYTISWTSDGGLDNSGNATIDAVLPSTAVAAGTEGYGVELTPSGNTQGGTCTAQGIWGAGFEDPVSTIAQNLEACTKANLPSASADTTNTSLMQHKASVSVGTPAGSYDQVVTYYVTANF